LNDESPWKVREFSFWNRAGILLSEFVVVAVVVSRVSWANELVFYPVFVFLSVSLSNFT